jgi:hypothetical protein
MRHSRGTYLSTRPAFLLAACCRMMTLPQSPEKFAGSPREEVWMCFPKY